MELRHLRYFVAVADELHFGRAAEKLCIAQPPLSIQIKQLEKELGFSLFSRTNRKVELTEAGAYFLDEVRHNLAGLHEAVSAARRVARGESGWLGIGFVGSAAYDILPRILAAFRSEYPDVELVLRELVSAKQAAALREGRIHVGLARPSIEESGIESDVLLNERFVVALPAAHPLCGRSQLALEELASENFILFPRIPKPSSADSIIAVCVSAGFRPNMPQEAAEMHTAVGLVAGGLGVTLVPESVRTESRPGLAFRPLKNAPTTALTVTYRRSERTPQVDSFLRICRTTARVV